MMAFSTTWRWVGTVFVLFFDVGMQDRTSQKHWQWIKKSKKVREKNASAYVKVLSFNA